MPKFPKLALLLSLVFSGCATGTNPTDPYEPFNRKVYNFNRAFDATFLKPPAKLYVSVVPGFVRKGVNNFYNNIATIPTIANDLLQAEFRWAIKDTWRLFFNTTVGIGGIWDAADSHFGLPPHYNDLGITFAKWGNKQSPYIMLPFLGPSTIRDAMGEFFEYSVLTPYPYIRNEAVLYSLLGVRYVDLRSQLFDTEKLMNEAVDPYAFIRDAYLQHRQYRIEGKDPADTHGLLQEDDSSLGADYIDE